MWVSCLALEQLCTRSVALYRARAVQIDMVSFGLMAGVAQVGVQLVTEYHHCRSGPMKQWRGGSKQEIFRAEMSEGWSEQYGVSSME